MKIVLATRNVNKAGEIRSLLAGWMPEVYIAALSLNDFPDIPEVEETGDTFQENAVQKAAAYTKATGLLCLADDSGLEVDALGGLPGVRSARFAAQNGGNALDPDNRRKVLNLLKEIKESRRTARFKCAVALATPNGRITTAEGVVDGYILEEERGDGGFGYDPIFLYPPLGKTFAEISSEEKNRVSHRSRAIKAIIPAIIRECENQTD
jgi:XTP/dITP diphosphohydrolase